MLAGLIATLIIGVGAVAYLVRQIHQLQDRLADEERDKQFWMSKANHLDREVQALQPVARTASSLLPYLDRSVDSFYGNTSAPTVQEQALSRAFEVERNTGIRNLRSAVKAYGEYVETVVGP